jgi:hypothetical protein
MKLLRLSCLFIICRMPVACFPHEKERALKSWRLISNGQASEFFRLKKADPENIPCKTPMEFFGNRFYRRLLEVHPTCQSMFAKTTMKQGSLLLRMISFVINTMEEEDESKFIKSMESLAHSHNKIGVKAVECKFPKFIVFFQNNYFIFFYFFIYFNCLNYLYCNFRWCFW